VKGTSIKDGSHVVLSDSNSVSFARCNFTKWEIISLSKVRLEIIEAKGLKKVDSFFTGGNVSISLIDH
jgi:hypothetical protein